MDVSYPPPLDQLLSLGDPGHGDWRDYRALGLSDEHVPLLIDLMRDERLSWVAQEQGEDDAPFWAPAHAWRALGQLGAAAAVGPLIAHVFDNSEDDWVLEDIPEVLGMIGAAALVPVADALGRAAAEPESDLVPVLANALKQIARLHPPLRGRAAALLIEPMIEWSEHSAHTNAWLISALLDLRAADAAPLIQAAFAAGAVEEEICGDWEDAQLELGLLARRITPRPRYDHHFGSGARFASPPRPAKPAPVPGSDSAAARSRSLRKAQKKAGKRKRR